MAKPVSEHDALADLRRVADEIGKVPSRTEYTEHGEYHHSTLSGKFGSWTAAREAAGLEGGPKQKTAIGEDEIIADIQRVAEKVGSVPSRREYRKRGEYAGITAEEKFGSWTAARQAAGLDGGPTKNTFVSQSDLIEDLQQVAEELGESPSQPQYNQHGKYTHQVAYDRFDSWNDALDAAGLATEYDAKLPKEELLDDIRRVGEQIGDAPSQTEYSKHGEHGVTTVKRRFKSWAEAVRKAGFEPYDPGAPSGETNGFYKGGYEPYYGPTWHTQRRRARKRDEYRCQACGMTDHEHKDRYGWELEVHHIIPIREFDDLGAANELKNLVTLCRRHHRKYEYLPADEVRALKKES